MIVCEGRRPETNTFTTQIRKEFPDIKIVIIATWPGINRTEAAYKAGAHSYINSYKGNEYKGSEYLFHVPWFIPWFILPRNNEVIYE